MEREYLIYGGNKYNHYIISGGIVLGVVKKLKLDYVDSMTGIRIVKEDKRILDNLNYLFFYSD